MVKKEIPAAILYQDEESMVFMDIGPIVKGHLLVIPKKHYDPVTDTPDAVLCHLIKLCKQMAAALKTGLGAEGVNIMQNNGACAGQEVPHLHFHVIPRFADDGHHWNWVAQSYAAPQEMNRLAEKIKTALQP
jgi:histidine triad (HIT) family protein